MRLTLATIQKIFIENLLKEIGVRPDYLRRFFYLKVYWFSENH